MSSFQPTRHSPSKLSRREFVRRTLVMGLPLAVGVALSACGQASTPSGNAQNGGSANTPKAHGSTQAGNVYPENGLPKDKEVTINGAFWVAGYGRDYFDEAINTFQKKFPNVHITGSFGPKVAKLVATKISAGDNKDMFHFFQTSDTPVQSLAKEGKLESMDDLKQRSPYDTPDKTLNKLAAQGAFEHIWKVNNHIYTLPIEGSVEGLYYDVNFFKKHGWNQAPKTWNEFTDLMADIKKDGISPLIFPGVYPGYCDYLCGAKQFELAEQEGKLDAYLKDWRNYTGPQYTTPEYEERWERVYELGKNGYFYPGLVSLTHTQSQMLVIQHKVAIVCSGAWIRHEMDQATPKGFEWGYMAAPYIDKPDGTIWVLGSYGDGWYVWKEKPDLERRWAKEFALWFWNMDVQEKLVDASALSVRNDYMDDPKRAARMPDSPRATLKYLKEHKTHTSSQWRAITLTAPEAQKASKNLQDAVPLIATGKKDPKPVLQQSEKLLQEAISAYKKGK